MIREELKYLIILELSILNLKHKDTISRCYYMINHKDHGQVLVF
jgi:hypothetical protein